MDDATAQNATRILIRFVTDLEGKVRYGLRQRQLYHEAVERGEEPRDYRSDFLNKMANDIFGWLAQQGQAFSAQYPQDRLSVEDFKDVLITAHARLNSRTR